MSNGVAWALRDDLNTATSSEPYVLVSYTGYYKDWLCPNTLQTNARTTRHHIGLLLSYASHGATLSDAVVCCALNTSSTRAL